MGKPTGRSTFLSSPVVNNKNIRVVWGLTQTELSHLVGVPPRHKGIDWHGSSMPHHPPPGPEEVVPQQGKVWAGLVKDNLCSYQKLLEVHINSSPRKTELSWMFCLWKYPPTLHANIKHLHEGSYYIFLCEGTEGGVDSVCLRSEKMYLYVHLGSVFMWLSAHDHLGLATFVRGNNLTQQQLIVSKHFFKRKSVAFTSAKQSSL